MDFPPGALIQMFEPEYSPIEKTVSVCPTLYHKKVWFGRFRRSLLGLYD